MSAFWDQLPEFEGPGGRFAQRYRRTERRRDEANRAYAAGQATGARTAAARRRTESPIQERTLGELKRALAQSCHPDLGDPGERRVREDVFKTIWPILNQKI